MAFLKKDISYFIIAELQDPWVIYPQRMQAVIAILAQLNVTVQ